MRNPNGFSANDSKDEKNTGNGEVQRPKTFFRRIGSKINDIVRNQERKKHEKLVLASIAKIKRLAESNDAEDWQELQFIQSGSGDVDISDDRVLEVLLGTCMTYDDNRLTSLINHGVAPEKIINNEHIKALALSKFESLFRGDDVDSPDSSLKIGEKFVDAISSSPVLLQVLDDVLKDEDIRKKLEDKIGKDAINGCGDGICEYLMYQCRVAGEDKKVYEERCRKGLEVLERVGEYDYFDNQNEEKREERISKLLGNGSMCYALNALGFVNGDVVDAVYEMKSQKLAEYSKKGLSDIGEKWPNESDSDFLRRTCYIPDWLEPNEDNEKAQYWREQNRKCGFDAMILVAGWVHASKGQIDWSDGIGPSDAFFEAANSSTFPLGDIMHGRYSENRDTMIFLSHNLERIGDYNMRGLIGNWAKIQCETVDETEAVRLRYLKCVARAERFKKNNPVTGELREVMLFDENGNPTEEFFDYNEVCLYNPKEFLPFVDKEWRKHYSDAQLSAIDFADEFPTVTESLMRHYSVEEWPRVLEGNLEACRGLAEFSNMVKHGFISSSVVMSNIGEYFDKSGPKPELWRAALELKEFHFLTSVPKEMQKEFGFDESTWRLIELRQSFGMINLPDFVLTGRTYIDENGEEKTESWTKNIARYFDEKGPKPELWQDALERKQFRFLRIALEKMQQKLGFDEATRKLIEYRYKMPDFVLTGRTYIDENGEEKTESWTKNIARYFDEKGPKPEFITECLKNGEFEALRGIDEELLHRAELDDVSRQVVLVMSGRENITFPLSSSNTVAALTKFIRMDAIDWRGATEEDLKIREAFMDSDAKDLVLNKLRRNYEGYLRSKKDTAFPVGLLALSDYMHRNDGAGPLTQVEAFLDFVGVLGQTGEDGKELTAAIEESMRGWRWTNQDKTNFYAVSAEVIQASPEIYLEFAKLFASVEDKKDFETFVKGIYPLYRAKLALLRKYNESSNKVGDGRTTVYYEDEDKKVLKEQLHNLSLPFNLKELPPEERRKAIDKVRGRILGEITDLFQSKLGIRSDAVPEDFRKGDIRAIEDMTLYLSNMSGPTKEKGDLVGLFLALQLDRADGWEKLRRGEAISLDDYLKLPSDGSSRIQRALSLSRENDPINKENTGIVDPERLHDFRIALQREVSAMRVGSALTIDQRLSGLIDGIEDLTNPDLYSDEMDKRRIEILERYSPRFVGSVTTKMWQRASGRDTIRFVDEEKDLADELTALMEENGIAITPENIKQYLQGGFDAIKMPFIVRQIVEDKAAKEAISQLQQLLVPSSEVIRVFNKLDEGLQSDSGTLAVGVYLDFLENLVVKYEDRLTDEDKNVVRDYLGAIRLQMSKLEKMYDAIVEAFDKRKSSADGTRTEQFQAELAEISDIVHGASSDAVFVTTCTGDMPTIIENMRACLSAKTKGGNNDTNLTFGESYKFYLCSNGKATGEGTTSDQIVYFVPMEHDGDRKMSFVLDKLYGLRNVDAFVGHVEVVMKKAVELKRQFPEVPISIFIPSTTEEFTDEIRKKLTLPVGATIKEVANGVFDIPKSGFGDHYVEFSNADARKAGKRTASGIEIVLE